MSRLSSLFGRRSQPTKMQVFGYAASVLDVVISETGTGMLFSGSLVLKRNFEMHFQSGVPDVGGDVIGVVPIADLDRDSLADIGDIKISDYQIAEKLVNLLLSRALVAFNERCPQFAALPLGKTP